MAKVTLRCFYGGYETMDQSLFTAGQGFGKQSIAPYYFYLIEHPNGRVLFDTGANPRLATDPVGYLGSGAELFAPCIEEDNLSVNALRRVGIEPESITHVVNSHLHYDHAGGNRFFTKAQYIVQKEEVRTAYWPEPYQSGLYFREDFDFPDRIKTISGDYDLFGDGTVMLLSTPGHSQGHQSVLVNLEETGAVLLAADASYTEANYEYNCLPGILWSPEHVIQSYNRLREVVRKYKALIIFGHDISYWEKHVQPAPFVYK